MSEKKIIVKTWNEWDPLKYVIAGKPVSYLDGELKDYFPKQ